MLKAFCLYLTSSGTGLALDSNFFPQSRPENAPDDCVTCILTGSEYPFESAYVERFRFQLIVRGATKIKAEQSAQALFEWLGGVGVAVAHCNITLEGESGERWTNCVFQRPTRVHLGQDIAGRHEHSINIAVLAKKGD